MSKYHGELECDTWHNIVKLDFDAIYHTTIANSTFSLLLRNQNQHAVQSQVSGSLIKLIQMASIKSNTF